MGWWERFFEALKERIAAVFQIGDIGAKFPRLLYRTMLRIELFGASLPDLTRSRSWGVVAVLFLLALFF
jgi:hypothetical protein